MGALVVLGFLAILVRFVPRGAAGDVRLPRIVDDSIGMWVLRRATGRRPRERPRERPRDGEAAPEPAEARPADSFGPTRVSPIRHVASGSRRPGSVGPPPVAPIPVPRARRRRNQAHPRGVAGLAPGLGALAGLVATVVVAFVALGLVLQPRGTADGEVLGATGWPGSARPAGSVVTAILPGGSQGPPTVDPPWPDASESPPTAPPATTVPTRRPSATPRTTPSRRPTSTPTPTVNPTPRPSSPPAPTPPPSASPPLPPPLALVECAPPLLLSVACDASGSARAVTYAFDFGDGSPTETGEASTRSHTYLVPGSYIVTVTVTDAEGRTDSDSTVVTIE